MMRFELHVRLSTASVRGCLRSAMIGWPLILDRSFFNEEVPDRQRIHPRAEKSADCIRRGVHDSLAAQIE
jgi:hypothetical protein